MNRRVRKSLRWLFSYALTGAIMAAALLAVWSVFVIREVIAFRMF